MSSCTVSTISYLKSPHFSCYRRRPAAASKLIPSLFPPKRERRTPNPPIHWSHNVTPPGISLIFFYIFSCTRRHRRAIRHIFLCFRTCTCQIAAFFGCFRIAILRRAFPHALPRFNTARNDQIRANHLVVPSNRKNSAKPPLHDSRRSIGVKWSTEGG